MSTPTHSYKVINSAKDASQLLVSVYPGTGFLRDLIIKWRSYICPFEELLRLIPPGQSSLDIGCGMGLLMLLLAHSGKVKKGIGLDISSDAIRLARLAKLPKDCEIDFRCVSAGEAYPTERFDFVTCIDVLHHVPASKQREFISRVVRANLADTFIFKDVSPNPVWMAWASKLHDFLLSRQVISIRHEDEIKQWLAEEGLTVTAYQRMHRLCYSHYVIVAQTTSSTRSSLS